MRTIKLLSAIFVSIFLITACAKSNHWGQKYDIDKKWWKQEGQSWDRKNNIFMTIGYSNPDWTNKFDLRKSADLNARADVSAFMRSLVLNYMQEVRSRNYAVSSSEVEASSKEALLGSTIVARHYSSRMKQYKSLIKIDLNYFFNNVYDNVRHSSAKKARKTNKGLTEAELDQKIKESTEKAIADLRAIEEPVVEKSLQGE